MGGTLVYRRCSKSLEGVDPSRIHRMGPTLVYRGCGESLGGLRPLKDSRYGFYTSLKGMP